MKLWVDEYAPQLFAELDLHTQQNFTLQRLLEQQLASHVILSGSRGSGKLLRCRLLLQQLFGGANLQLRIESFVTQKKQTIELLNSAHTTELFASALGVDDKNIVQDVLRQYSAEANSRAFFGAARGPRFRVFVIHDADRLSLSAQASLRRTFEKAAPTCRFVLLVENTSDLIDALCSRCLCVRFPRLGAAEVAAHLARLAARAAFAVSAVQLAQIAALAHGDLRAAGVMLQSLALSGAVQPASWLALLLQIKDLVIERPGVDALLQCKALLYELYAHGVDMQDVMGRLLRELLADPRVPETQHARILKVVRNYSDQLDGVSRQIVPVLASLAYLCLICS